MSKHSQLIPDGVEIGLERTLYSAREDDGTVEVCARLTRGALQREVEVELTMRDDTATSESLHLALS